MTASRKKSVQDLQLDEIYLQNAQDRSGFWSDEGAEGRSVSARHGLDGFEAVQRPANDHGRRHRGQQAPDFIFSRHFWVALVSTIVFCGLFTVLMGFGNELPFSSLIANPRQYAMVWVALAVIASLQWLFALSAHRQSVNNELMRRVMLATRRMQEPHALAAEAGHRINQSFDRVFAEIDARMALLDERSALLANHIATSMHRSAEAADANLGHMRGIVDASETQREALKRTGMMISTDIMPVIAKLETTVTSLDTMSQSAHGILETIGDRLQQTTQDLKHALEAFSTANQTVAPELEKRIMRFEASIAQLPAQIDATIGRLSPMSETIADAAMLSTANVEVIDQLAKDMTAALDKSRDTFAQISATGAELFQQAVDAHAGRFRDMLAAIVAEEAGRVSGLSQELGKLADAASAVVDRLQQPVSDMTSASDRAMASLTDVMANLDQRVATTLSGCVTELNDAVTRLSGTVTREIEASAIGLQTRLAAGATELMQRVHSDTARFEGVIGETADRSAARIAAAIKDLPAVLAQRMDTEIAKIDGSLKGSMFSLSEQMRQIVETVPNRMTAMTRETMQALESNLLRSFDDVAQRSEQLNEQFRASAAQTAESVLQGYVDFIFVAVDRFRKELDAVNGSFTRDLEAKLAALPRKAPAPEPDAPSPEADPTTDR